MHTRNLITPATLAVVSTGMLFASGAIKSLFSANCLPHRYVAQPGLIRINVVTNLLIALSYFPNLPRSFAANSKLHHLSQLRAYVWVPLYRASTACSITSFPTVLTQAAEKAHND